MKVRMTVVNKTGQQGWSGESQVRLDLRLASATTAKKPKGQPSGMGCHLYVPSTHALAGLRTGATITVEG